MANKGNYRHGGSTRTKKTEEYISWSAMRDRCNNPKNKRFSRYGGRGIKVCGRWSDFVLFLADMGQRPSPQHTIERKNNDLDYTPDNCCWATRSEQNANQSHTKKLTAFGRTQSISAWSREIGIRRESLRDRLAKGMSVEAALSTAPAGHGFKKGKQ